MKEWLIIATEYTIVVIDAMALIIIAIGTVRAFVSALVAASSGTTGHARRDIWLHYGRWLVAGLTFQLAADIVESSIATDWQSVARLGAIAVIRTFLNYFLERDLEDVRARQHEAAARSATPG